MIRKHPTTATDHAIIYVLRTPHFRQSAVTFAGRYALVPATILVGGTISRKAGKRLTAALHAGKFVDVDDAGKWPDLRELQFRLVHRTASDELAHADASIRYVFNCPNVADGIVKLLNGFESTSSKPANWDWTSNQAEARDFSLGQCAMSAFVLLESHGPEIANATPRLSLEEILLAATGREKCADVIAMRPCRRLDRVATVTTPFGNEVFFGSINFGSVANRFGANDCLLVVSQSLVAGCDGGAVYNEQMHLIGIVISTTFRWHGFENATMTLVASFAELLDEFLRQWRRFPNLRVERNLQTVDSLHPCENSVILIEVGTASGTGFFLKVKNSRFIVTCAHVVFDAETSKLPISCTWSGGHFEARLLYRNPQLGAAFDIALLEVPDAAGVPDSNFATPSRGVPRSGHRVLAAGFPHFYALAKQQWAPSLLEGRLTRVTAHMVLSDASVQAGLSGGPLLYANGKVVAMVISNTRVSETGQICPRVNMCMPIAVVVEVLDAFVETGDVAVFDRFQATAEEQRAWNLQPEVISSKM